VAVRLIVEREREIAAFKPEEYWKISAFVAPDKLKLSKEALAALPPPKTSKAKVKKAAETTEAPEAPAEKAPPVKLPDGAFLAEWAGWAGKKFEASAEDQVKPIVAALEKAAYLVRKVEQKDRSEKAPPPFTTSTLQQQASLRLHYSAKRTMMTAQRLYEGVELGAEGSVALITYMRTDSTRIADEALNQCRNFIQKEFGEPYLPEKPNRYAASKDAQGAHEAIRPTDLAYSPERVVPFLPQDQLRLYTLIYNRFVACQMKPAIFAVT